MHPVAVAGGLHRFVERRITYDDIQQTVQAHEGLPSGNEGHGPDSRLLPGTGNAKGPTRITGRGESSVRRPYDSRARDLRRAGAPTGREAARGGARRVAGILGRWAGTLSGDC
ncbi:hypothetical protein GCM10009647_001810 [Streptomyces sanglieri]